LTFQTGLMVYTSVSGLSSVAGAAAIQQKLRSVAAMLRGLR
jgi:hypothetical protein